MISLPIIWQRLVSSDGKTCDRCDATYQAIQRAFNTLKETLRPLGIEPTLKRARSTNNHSRPTPLSPTEFGLREDPWRNGLVQESEAAGAVLCAATRSVERWRSWERRSRRFRETLSQSGGDRFGSVIGAHDRRTV